MDGPALSNGVRRVPSSLAAYDPKNGRRHIQFPRPWLPAATGRGAWPLLVAATRTATADGAPSRGG